MSTADTSTRLLADAVIPGDGTNTILRSGAIDIDGAGRILAVATQADMNPDWNGNVCDVGGLLMPGLVNSHAHTPMILMRSAGDGLPLQEWLSNAVWPREGQLTPEDVWWGQTLGSIEMLRAGVTTTLEMYLFEDEVARAATAVGQRIMVAAGIISALAPEDAQFENRVGAISNFYDKNHKPEDRVYVGYGPHSSYDHPPERLSIVAAAATERNALVTIHLEETQVERDLVKSQQGKSATQVFSDSGLLEANVLAAHGVWLDDTDRALLGAAGAAVAHCPQSNGKLGSGIADVPAMLEAGITVGIGTDGPASNDSLSLWDELRLAPLFARAKTANPEALNAATALDLATRQGARAMGIDDVGELRPGAWADVIRLDLDQPAFQPGLDGELFNHVVWAASAEHVTDVWVKGEQVVEAGEVTLFDRHEAQHEVKSRAGRLIG